MAGNGLGYKRALDDAASREPESEAVAEAGLGSVARWLEEEVFGLEILTLIGIGEEGGELEGKAAAIAEGLKPLIIARNDPDLVRLAKRAEARTPKKGKGSVDLSIRRPKEASPFELDAAGDQVILLDIDGVTLLDVIEFCIERAH